MLVLAATASATTLTALTVGTNTAGSSTTATIDAALVQSPQSIDSIRFNLPTSLTANWSIINTNRCSNEVVYGSDPVGECPASSVFGTAIVSSPLIQVPIEGHLIAYDAGGSLPGLALIAEDAGETVESRAYFSVSNPTTVSGTLVQLWAEDVSGPALEQMTLFFTGSTAGQFLKVQSAANCHANDAIDTMVITDAGYTSFGTGGAVSFSGCSNGGWITGGPATGDVVSSDAVTFNYHYTGGGSFTKFRCGLVSYSDPNAAASQLVDCGTIAAGSSKTYSGLPNGSYAFRVSKYPTGGSTDLRKFEIRRPSLAIENGAVNTATGLELSASVGTGESYLSEATLRLPTSLIINGAALGSTNICSAAVAEQPDPQENCPDAVFGTADLTAQGGSVYHGYAIVVDSGGSIPNLLVYADLGGSNEWRAAFDMWDRNTGAGNVMQLSVLEGDLVDDSQQMERIDINLTGGTSGQLFKVKTGNYCYSADTMDATIEVDGSSTSDSMGSSNSAFTGCNTGGLITSGPATGSIGNSSSVTFSYSYSGSGFSKFRCALVKLSDPSASATTVDCGTVKTGSSKTYTGLSNGVYQFRVLTNSTVVYDMRKFKVGS